MPILYILWYNTFGPCIIFRIKYTSLLEVDVSYTKTLQVAYANTYK